MACWNDIEKIDSDLGPLTYYCYVNVHHEIGSPIVTISHAEHIKTEIEVGIDFMSARDSSP